MNRCIHCIVLSVLFCLAACSSNSAEETQNDGAKTLPVPTVTVTVSDLTANVRWSISENVTNVRFTYEFYKDGAETPLETATTRQSSHDFALEEDVLYKVRVRATAPVGTNEWKDSDFSEFVEVSTENGGDDPNPDPQPGVDVGLPLAGEDDGVIRAFPGAEGGGMYVTGGRGGKVYHVTKLDDDGSVGTLRHAVSQSGARIIVFDVCGTIRLTKTLEIKNDNLTIAGQTAPGDGICLRDHSVQVKADNVIIRYLRFRMGDVAKSEDDAIWGRYNENLILDHCTMSWSTDECASFYANRNFTMQWCLLSESLRNSIHGKGKHGYGGLWGGRNASFHHNMLADHDSRNARIDHPGIYVNGSTDYRPTHRGNVDLRNNVIYNWGDNSTYGGEDGSYNLVGNYYKPGPASKQRKYFVDAYWYNSSFDMGSAYPRIYMEDNYHAGSYASALNSDNWNGGVSYHDQSKYGTNPSTEAGHLTAPLSIKADDATTCYTTTHPVADAYERVLAYVGASLRRDAVDTRVISDARAGKATYTGSNGSTGGLIDTQEDVGGWPVLTATDEEIARAATDTDGDGIPDYYEELLGLDKNDASDAAAKTLDPQGLYSNLEVYLHYLVKDITAAQVAGGTYTALD
ncbi:pectate lyase [uncultured Alistipes sp.]|uniref:pectate lyase n=1 Tax=uncultured Alistipes sp. TaxID=538949 RepID=UPI00260C712E|nr:pectate lyase [uncultured Alistipes sp.]